MKKHVRPATPQILQEHGERWNNQWTEKKTANPTARFNWYQHQNRSVREWILDDLRSMTQGHCSFCDSFPIEPSSSESIEHFRPKSDIRFLHLAYAWENLFYCCDGCQKSKLEKWDDALLKPDAEDYDFDRYFRFDYTTGAVLPNPSAEDADQSRARVTINLYNPDSHSRRKYRLLEMRRWCRANDMSVDDFAYRDFVAAF